MKKITPIVVVALFGALTFMPSCKKSDSSPSTSMSATINGTSFSSSKAIGVNAFGSIVIAGFQGKAEMELFLDSINTTTPQTYTIHPNNVGAFGGTYISDTSQFLTNPSVGHTFDSGTLVITSVSSKSAVGTFTLYSTFDSSTATNGKFSATWQ